MAALPEGGELHGDGSLFMHGVWVRKSSVEVFSVKRPGGLVTWVSGDDLDGVDPDATVRREHLDRFDIYDSEAVRYSGDAYGAADWIVKNESLLRDYPDKA